MSLIRLHNVTKRYDSRLVLREAHFRLGEGERVGLIGKNGVGKTTLLKLVLGEEEPTEGAVEIADGVQIGYFSQFSELGGQQTVEERLGALFADIREIEGELGQIESGLAGDLKDKEMKRLLNRQAELFEQMERRDGWNYPNRIDTALTRLGFTDAYRTRSIERLSAGWRNRAALAEIILSEPDVLLMDEPTNYLDVQGLRWLEEWFQKFRGALIVVSHDRDFLDHVATRIVEIENYHPQSYDGCFTEYVRQKRLRGRALEHQFRHEEELLAYEAEAIIDRREAERNPSKALKRRLADIKRRQVPRPVDKIVTGLYASLHVSTKLCEVGDLAKSYGEESLFDDVSFLIERGTRMVIVGPNGSGKTTLLQILAGETAPDAGEVRWTKGGDFVYYNRVLEELAPDDSVTHAVNIMGIAYGAARKRVNAFLGLMQFSEMDLAQRISTLSGGQKARVALAKCLLWGASVVLLDSPYSAVQRSSVERLSKDPST